MIQYTKGNLLESSAEALVNTVNEVGVMGKGIALMFKESFPANTRAYLEACKAGEIRVGRMFVVRERDLTGDRWIINFPTKKHWRNPSKLQWVQDGLKDLARVICEKKIRSIALPPLGCGNGGLEWSQVRQEIEAYLASLDHVQINVYEPTSDYQNAPKREGVADLTPARALIADLVRRYAILGLQCTNLEVQKLGWFLQRVLDRQGLSNILALNYSANKYGPYADNLRHLLNALDGSYLHCEKRLSDAGPFDSIWFEDSQRQKVSDFFLSAQGREYLPPLEETAKIIDGFESPLGMELLATVDWILAKMNCEPTLDSVKDGLKRWPGGSSAAKRKMKLFDDRLILLALTRLRHTSLAVSR